MILVKKKAVRLMVMALLVMGGTVTAQQNQQMMQQQQQQKDYSAEQIDLFANAVAQVLPVQQEAEQEMIAKIKDEGMELNQFNQIANQMKQGQQPKGVSEDDMKKFQNVSEKIQSINLETQKEINKIITDAGISLAIYQEMIQAYSANPDVKQKVDQKLAEQQQQ